MFLSDEWIRWFTTEYSILIGWVKWLIGTPLGAYVVMKALAIMNRNVPSNKILDLVQNTIGKVETK